MTDLQGAAGLEGHSHVFLGSGHEENERRTWGVIILCGVMMLVEIIGGSLFGSLALIADGLHMSTHAGAMLIAALAYTYARRHASDSRFVFGTGKLGDLAGLQQRYRVGDDPLSRPSFPPRPSGRESQQPSPLVPMSG